MMILLLGFTQINLTLIKKFKVNAHVNHHWSLMDLERGQRPWQRTVTVFQSEYFIMLKNTSRKMFTWSQCSKWAVNLLFSLANSSLCSAVYWGISLPAGQSGPGYTSWWPIISEERNSHLSSNFLVNHLSYHLALVVTVECSSDH